MRTTAGCERSRAVSVDWRTGLRQLAKLPTENSCPPIPTRCTIYCDSTRESWRQAPLNSEVAHSPSRSDLRPHEPNFNIFSSFESTAIARETEHSGRHPHEGCRSMCSDPLDPGGEKRGCSLGCTLGMSDISPSSHRLQCAGPSGVSRTRNCMLKPGMGGCKSRVLSTGYLV